MYAIVSSFKTAETWSSALKRLEEKYEKLWPGEVKQLLYKSDGLGVKETLPPLQSMRPSYTCFLTHHSECSIQLLADIHQVTRQIDPSNPFYDTIWGILTGLTEDDVLFAINQEQTLPVRRVLAGCPIDLTKFESGSWYSELQKCTSYHCRRDQEKPYEEECPQDTTEILASKLSEERKPDDEKGCDMMITSGHATENDWQIGYTYRNGQFVCQEGKLVGLSSNRKWYPITGNGQPKILSAAGNCLMGHIDKPNCMALAWMHSAGVVQMIGYTVTSWYGFAGWGVHKYFIELPGLFSFAESFFGNHQALVANLFFKHSDWVERSYRDYPGFNSECSGLLHDKDVVAFYGDPAWDAKLVAKPETWPYELSVSALPKDESLEDGWRKYKIEVVTKTECSWDCPKGDDKTTSPGRPPIYIFPRPVKEYKIVEGGESLVIGCRFVMMWLIGTSKANETITALFALKE